MSSVLITLAALIVIFMYCLFFSEYHKSEADCVGEQKLRAKIFYTFNYLFLLVVCALDSEIDSENE